MSTYAASIREQLDLEESIKLVTRKLPGMPDGGMG
jgi:hypothetical protein